MMDEKREKMRVVGLICLIGIYFLILFYLRVLFRVNDAGGMNLNPFDFNGLFLNGSAGLALKNIGINIAAFLPVGFLSFFLAGRKKFLAAGVISFALSLLIESAQLVFKTGIFDINDLMNNTIGGLLGCGIGLCVYKLVKPGKKAFRMN